MSPTTTEADAMRRAVALSALGLGSTSPNPPVGCVILDSAGRTVGEGYHRRKGEPHAEANALAVAGSRAVGGTAVVTLEPCNHHGRTPPCHQALIDAGIVRVVIAVIDPTSRGAGGAARLRAAGVGVEVGVLAEEALVVLGPWLAALALGRPWVIWAYEVGPDGPRAMTDEVVAEAGIRSGVDAVLHGDGQLEEGVLGAHGRNTFTLPELAPCAEPGAILAQLAAGGVRILLVHGNLAHGTRFAEMELIDELRLFVPAPGAWPMTSRERTFFSPDFVIRSTRQLASGTLVTASTR